MRLGLPGQLHSSHPDEPEYKNAEILYIDPRTCIDCGACVEVCPVDAIKRDVDVSPAERDYLALNARFFDGFTYPQPGFIESVRTPMSAARPDRLRLAVVGSGPAGVYAVEAALAATNGDADIHVFERLPVPWGLVRYGVAPDHQDTKRITRGLERILSAPQVSVHLNVEIGRHLSHDDLLRHHHAVIYAVGAPEDRRLDIAGEALPGSHSAADFVAWYNGHPDAAYRQFDLSHPRAVIFGNGNVALDAARILVSRIEELARSDIAEYALDALRHSGVEEVLVVGRRGHRQAAYTTPELLALSNTPGVDLLLDPTGLDGLSSETDSAKAEFVATLPHTGGQRTGNKRVILTFLSSPVRVLGTEQVTGVRLMRNHLSRNSAGAQVVDASGETYDVECGLVLRAIGYRGHSLDGLRCDDEMGTFLHDRGRVLDDDGSPLPGVYAAGWAKRGPSGVIGTNRSCAGKP